jgi:hypothetical protein
VVTKDHVEISTHYIVGVDLGQANDPTAICVLEQKSWRSDILADHLLPKTRYDVRHLERLPLATPYPDQVSFVASLLDRAPLTVRNRDLVIDRTGVGRAIFDLFAEAGLLPVGVTITAGRGVSRKEGGWNVAKLELVGRLQAMLHAGDLRIAKSLPDAGTLSSELRDFRASFTSAGNAVFAAREGAHDDLVLSVAIAAWYAVERTRQGLQVCKVGGL